MGTFSVLFHITGEKNGKWLCIGTFCGFLCILLVETR